MGRDIHVLTISPSVTAYVKIPSEAFVGLLLNSGDRNNGNVFLTYGLCCLPYIEGIRPRIDAHAIYAPLPDQHMEDILVHYNAIACPSKQKALMKALRRK